MANEIYYELIYENIETGELFHWSDMKKELAEKYNANDPADPLAWRKYYRELQLV